MYKRRRCHGPHDCVDLMTCVFSHGHHALSLCLGQDGYNQAGATILFSFEKISKVALCIFNQLLNEKGS
jgi:hypothetical protein